MILKIGSNAFAKDSEELEKFIFKIMHICEIDFEIEKRWFSCINTSCESAK